MTVDVVVLAALSIGVIHSFAPDHYVPFVAIGKSKKWNAERIMLFSLAGGAVHVTSSITIGMLLIHGVDLLGIAGILENLSSHALIATGLIYALASLTFPHNHVKTSSAAFLIVLSLAPCVPLIPLLIIPGINTALVAGIYGFSTLMTVLILTSLTLKAFRPPRVFRGKEEFFTGMIIALTGIITYIFDLKFRRTQLYDLTEEL